MTIGPGLVPGADPRPGPGWGAVTGWTALALAGVGGGLLAARAVGVTPGTCVALGAGGVPCPACGLTRLAVHLGSGRLDLALGHDPAGAVLLAALAMVALVQLVVLVRRRAAPGWLTSPVLPAVLLALLGAHWATTLVAGLPPSA